MTDEEYSCAPGYCQSLELHEHIKVLAAERDDYAFKLADANNTYSEMHVALSEANDS